MAAVGSRRRAISKYSLTEVKNQACGLIDFYFILQDEESLGDALLVANSRWGRFPKLASAAVARMLDATGSKAQALASLANVIFAYILMSHSFVSELIDDDLGCPLSDAEFSDEPGLTTAEIFLRFRESYRCEINDPPRCNQDGFRVRNARNIDLIRSDSISKNAGVKKVQVFLTKLKDGNPVHARGLKHRCYKIGDLMIALQCPRKYLIVTSDAAFADFARVLRRDCQLLPSLAALLSQRSAPLSPVKTVASESGLGA